MDTKTAYTRTFLTLKEQPLHDESVKAAYFSWWQNVRETYQARSLRLTKIGYEWVQSLDIKTYNNDKHKTTKQFLYDSKTMLLTAQIIQDIETEFLRIIQYRYEFFGEENQLQFTDSLDQKMGNIH